MSEQQPAVVRAVEIALFAPLGLVLSACDHVPSEVRRRRQAFENRVQLARFIGQMVVQQGRKEVAGRLEARRAGGDEPAGPPQLRVVPAPAAERSDEVTSTAEQPSAHGASGTPTPPSAADLPIGDYESLAAIHVVERLATLRPDEREQIRAFEQAHRARRTILAKITQLQGG